MICQQVGFKAIIAGVSWRSTLHLDRTIHPTAHPTCRLTATARQPSLVAPYINAQLDALHPCTHPPELPRSEGGLHVRVHGSRSERACQADERQVNYESFGPGTAAADCYTQQPATRGGEGMDLLSGEYQRWYRRW